MAMLLDTPAVTIPRHGPAHDEFDPAPTMASVVAVARASVSVSASQLLLGAAAAGHLAGATANRAMHELRSDGAAVARLAAPARISLNP